MKAYRKTSGFYIELDDVIPVSELLTQVSLRPSINHVFTDNWQTDPLNPLVCWRPKSEIEINAEKDAKAVQMEDLKLAFASELEVLWDNIPALRTAFPDPNGKGKLKQSVVSAYRAKL